ncbi:MAG: radical SAM protein [bacterium]|nr:radical SAM protein [bacterium]
MNLIITRKCSNRCPYCFEVGESTRSGSSQISIANAERVARWVALNGLDALSLLGGEPFLHPELQAIVRVFRKICPKVSLTVFTGGYFDTALLNNLDAADVSLLINVNEPMTYASPGRFDSVICNAVNAIRRGFRTTLGFNVWELGFSPEFMPNLAYNLGRQTFRWTVAHPELDAACRVVGAVDFEPLATRCMLMLRKAVQLGLRAHLDCPIPVCFFSDEDLGWLAKYLPETASRLGTCDVPLDISPDLEVMRCFALSGCDRVLLEDFSSPEDLKRHFQRSVDRNRWMPTLFKWCTDCTHAHSGRCRGGCLARNGCIASTIDLPERMFGLIAKHGHAEALLAYRTAPPVLRSPLAGYLAAGAAIVLRDFDAAFRYAARALDTTEDAELKARVQKLLAEVPAPQSTPSLEA